MTIASIPVGGLTALLESALARGETETAAQIAKWLNVALNNQASELQNSHLKCAKCQASVPAELAEHSKPKNQEQWQPKNPQQAVILRCFRSYAVVGQVILFDELCRRYQQHAVAPPFSTGKDLKQAPWRRDVSNVLMEFKRYGIVSKSMPDGSHLQKNKYYVLRLP